MADRALDVFLDGTHIGALEQSPAGNLTFRYDDAYRTRHDATPLSLSMPVTRAQHPSRAVTPFLQGLLPDSSGRLDELAREFHTSASNPFALLRHVGGDVAGAVQILPMDASPSDAGERAGAVDRIKRLLVLKGYPPDKQPEAIKLVMEQMESMAPRYSAERGA